MSSYNSIYAKPEYLERWAAWMLTSGHVGIMSFDEYTALQRVLSRRQ